VLIYINFSFDFLGLETMFIFKITSPMNSYDESFFKYDKTSASDLYLIYKLSPSARVRISVTDRLLMFYLVHKLLHITVI
jgi:hypothetical protein